MNHMRIMRHYALIASIAILNLPAITSAQVTPTGSPAATIDLRNRDGAALVKGEWRYSDTRIVEVEHRAPGPDGQPTGETIRTYDYTPHAGGSGFDDSSWEKLDPTTLEQRRATGRICFNWYRINITVPERVGTFNTSGSTIAFETTIDDYAEIWVDGELPRGIGQRGGSVVGGWNTPNRLVIARNVQPGRKIQLAVFGINGPISDPPANFIWMRSAKLDFYPGTPESTKPFTSAPQEVNFTIDRIDSGLDAIVPSNPKLYKLAEGFKFTEGPLWVKDGLVFSDPNDNRIYHWSTNGSLEVLRERSGYAGADIAEYGQPGSNGITQDKEGRLVLCQHGNHAIVRLEKDGTLTKLVDSYEGKRLNSPNDIVCKSDGAIYFTDPPFGLPKFFNDPRKQLSFSGVYRFKDGKLTLLSKELAGPNGIAFSPDEKYLYVDNWDEKRKVVMRYEVSPNGVLMSGQVFFDMGGAPESEALDGMKIDQRGNLYVSGPGGIWILSPVGKHLGTIRCPQMPANFAWGDADGKTLYMTARTGIYRMRLNISGIRPEAGK